MTPRQTIAHYRIVSKLGEGGMGEVYRATDTKLGREVAIKILPAGFAQDPGRMARFEREAKVLASLNHPNIAAIYGVEERALVMELVEGPTLAERIKHGAIPLNEAILIARQAAEALAYAHEKGIVHRDVKPDNIKLTPAGRVKVLDFGLAKMRVASDSQSTETGLTQAGAILGTPAYIAPEQALGKPVDARSDIFSFGCVLYEMLCGRRAFTGATAVSVIAAILHTEPHPLRELVEVPSEVDSVVVRAISKAPEARFPGMRDLLRALETAAQTPPRPQGASIAVLPFANLSPDKENEYFCDGLAEEILSALGTVPSLRVIARASAFACRACTAREIGERLKVTAALMGSVRRMGSRIRVSVQLIEVAGESQIWSDRYDRDMADVFAVQDEIAQAIVHALAPRLSAGVKPAAPKPTANLDAYHHFLRARHHLYKLDASNLQLGRQFLERAIAADPGYAPAYFERAHIVLSLLVLGFIGVVPFLEEVPRAIQDLETAIALDPSLADAQGLRGVFLATFHHRWREGLHDLDQAVALNPTSYLMLTWRAAVLLAMHRLQEAVEQQELAVRADPYSALAHAMMGSACIQTRNYERAVTAFRQALEIAPGWWVAQSELAYTYARMGDFNAALRLVEQARPGTEPLGGGLHAGYRGCVYVLTGQSGKAEALLRELEASRRDRYVAAFGSAMIHAEMGDPERAFAQLERAFAEREIAMLKLPTDPSFDRLRPDPRFHDLLQRMNLA
jgi:TolB-like protein/Flp pilus assembly protein TadD/predicted Ser/Thr protein kinase